MKVVFKDNIKKVLIGCEGVNWNELAKLKCLVADFCENGDYLIVGRVSSRL